MAAASKKLRQSNSRPFSEHLKELGAPLKNARDRWCSVSDTQRRAFFTVWSHKLVGGRYVFADLDVNDPREGAKELRLILPKVVAEGYEAYGVLAERKIVKGIDKGRGPYSEETLLKLAFHLEGRLWIGDVLGEIRVRDLQAGNLNNVSPFPNAIDDLDGPPPGVERPPRMPLTGTGFRRDPAVRAYVIKEAKGSCEYCGTKGFVLPDGRHYLEAHHIIGLADDGPDTPENVIALCPAHHREAHYGRAWEELQREFFATLLAKRK